LALHNPKYIGGLNNTFTYKGFELTVFLQGVYGNDILNANRFELEYLNGTNNQSKDVLTGGHPTNTNTDIPRGNFNKAGQQDLYTPDRRCLLSANENAPIGI
jgi:hypothetical protein